MKKTLLSVSLILIFAIYLIIQKNTNESQTATSALSGPFKDGQYEGNAADAFYGNIQVSATVSGGRLTDVKFLQYPSDRETSVQINTQAMPLLRQEAITAQSAKVDIITGATQSSQAFIQSLQSALDQARD